HGGTRTHNYPILSRAPLPIGTRGLVPTSVGGAEQLGDLVTGHGAAPGVPADVDLAVARHHLGRVQVPVDQQVALVSQAPLHLPRVSPLLTVGAVGEVRQGHAGVPLAAQVQADVRERADPLEAG